MVVIRGRHHSKEVPGGQSEERHCTHSDGRYIEVVYRRNVKEIIVVGNSSQANKMFILIRN